MGFPLSVLFIVLVFQECLAGVMIDQVMKDREGTSSRVTLYFSGERLRTDDVDHGLSTIMDFKGDRMVMVDHRSKNYIEVRFSQWEEEVGEQLKKGLPAVRPKMRRIVVRRAGKQPRSMDFGRRRWRCLLTGSRLRRIGSPGT